MMGLWRRRAIHPNTRISLSLLQLGYLDKAQVGVCRGLCVCGGGVRVFVCVVVGGGGQRGRD
jgi:hypothetical protein